MFLRLPLKFVFGLKEFQSGRDGSSKFRKLVISCYGMLWNAAECASFRVNIAAMAIYPKPGWPETIAIEAAFEGRYLRDG